MVEVVVVARAWGRLRWCEKWRASEKSRGDWSYHSEEHDTHGKVAYGEPLGIKLHRIVVVTSEATNREKGWVRPGATRTSLR
jgi:hypothetical protein